MTTPYSDTGESELSILTRQLAMQRYFTQTDPHAFRRAFARATYAAMIDSENTLTDEDADSVWFTICAPAISAGHKLRKRT